MEGTLQEKKASGNFLGLLWTISPESVTLALTGVCESHQGVKMIPVHACTLSWNILLGYHELYKRWSLGWPTGHMAFPLGKTAIFLPRDGQYMLDHLLKLFLEWFFVSWSTLKTNLPFISSFFFISV